MTKNSAVTFRSDTSDRKATVARGPMVVRAMIATTDDTSVIVVDVYFFDGENERQIAAVSVPVESGTDGSAVGVDLLNGVDSPWVQVDANGNNVVRLGDRETLRVGVASAPGAGKRLDVISLGDDE